MSGTIGVPEAPCSERGVVGTAMHLEVAAHVVARDVAPDLRRHHVVVHRRVEDGALALGAEGCLDARELLVPSFGGSAGQGVEVPGIALLGIQVNEGIGLAGGREGHLDHYLVVGVHFEGSLAVLRVRSLAQPIVDRLVEAHAEVDNLVVCPAVAATIAHQGVVVDGDDACVACLVANGVLQVDDDAGIVAAAGEGEAIECGALRGSHLGHDAEAVEEDAVVARDGHFRLVAIVAGNALTGEFYVAIGRHEADVAQVAATGTAEVHLAEADNLLTRLVIAGAPVPARLELCGAGIDHAERHVGPHEDMSVVARTDSRVNVLCKVFRCRSIGLRIGSAAFGLCHGCKQKAKDNDFSFHEAVRFFAFSPQR